MPCCRMRMRDNSFRKQDLSYQIDHLIRELPKVAARLSACSSSLDLWPPGALLSGGPARPTGGLLCARMQPGEGTPVCPGEACVVQPSRV